MGQLGVPRGAYQKRARPDKGEAKLDATLERGIPPKPEDWLRWAQQALENAIDIMERHPNDRAIHFAVIRRKKELVALREKYRDKRVPGYVFLMGGSNGKRP